MSRLIGRVDGLVVRFWIHTMSGQSTEVDLDTASRVSLRSTPPR